MSWDHYEAEDQPLDELAYGKCRVCGQLEELNDEELCLICEGHDRDSKSSR